MQVNISGQEVHFGTSENLNNLGVGSQATLIFTSPPYWNLKDYGTDDEIGKGDYEFYLSRLVKVFDECYEHSSPNAILAVNLGQRRTNKVYRPISWDLYRKMVELGSKWKILDNIIWYIPNALPQPNWYINRLFDNKYENVTLFSKNHDYDYTFNKIRVPQKWINHDPRSHKKNPDGRCVGNIIRIPAYRPPNVKKMNYHQAAFPEELVQIFVDSFSNEGDVVMDPFLGSGTTLKVCRAMNRKGIGVEINSECEELIRERVNEEYSVVAYTKIDLIHSSTATVDEHKKVNNKPRRKKKK